MVGEVGDFLHKILSHMLNIDPMLTNANLKIKCPDFDKI